ncbi:MAG TPA: FAD-binding oxidoreductase [Patescibacteria group bacterium]
MKTIAQHKEIVEKISSQIKDYLTSHKEKKLRFYHGSTNSTRDQSTNDKYYFIDISNFNDVLEVNTEHKYALVEPNVPMDKLVKATLEYGLMPPVVMEFPGITAGGAVNGATLEASSYKFGQFNDNCVEYEIVLGNGEIIHATEKEYNDIFYGISGSYGSLGLLTLVKLKLIPSMPYVKTVFSFSGDYSNTLNRLTQETKKAESDFLDAIVFGKNDGVVIKGYLHPKKDENLETFSKATDKWFYERAQKVSKDKTEYEEIIPIVDFLFRYNRGAYWMGEYTFPLLHLPDNKITKTILNPFMNTRKLYDGLHDLNASQDYFIQDFYCPLENSLKFMQESEEKLNIFPIWLCPMKPTKTAQKLSPSYIDTDLIIDIGIWGQSKKYLKSIIQLNRYFESYAKKVMARKMLYAHAYYSKEEFWEIYDRDWYHNLRKKYHSEEIFPDVWEKTHVENKRYQEHFWKGIWQLLKETLKGKNLNN